MFSKTTTSPNEESIPFLVDDSPSETRTDSGFRSWINATTAMLASIMLVATPTSTAVPRKLLMKNRHVESQWVDSSTLDDETTLAQLRQQHIVVFIKRILAEARETTFEDGVASSFSHRIEQLIIGAVGQEAIEALITTIRQPHLDGEAIGEALRWIGKLRDPGTHDARRRLLERALESNSARIRDGAGLGLAYLDDPIALPALSRAIASEQRPSLKVDLALVREQLTETQHMQA